MQSARQSGLEESEEREAVAIALAGGDRELIAQYLGRTTEAISAAERSDRAFGRELRRAEAGAELLHVRNVQRAAQEESNWRTSVWWLERRAPHRYARRDTEGVTRTELVRFLNRLAEKLVGCVESEADRVKLLAQLDELAEQVTDPLAEPLVDSDECAEPVSLDEESTCQ